MVVQRTFPALDVTVLERHHSLRRNQASEGRVRVASSSHEPENASSSHEPENDGLQDIRDKARRIH